VDPLRVPSSMDERLGRPEYASYPGVRRVVLALATEGGLR
jgi:hypothetical protein